MKYFITSIKVTILTIFLLASLTAKANAASDLASLLANFQSMKANFEQVVLDQNQHPIQKNIGDMALKRPGQFRWEVKQPTPQLLLTDSNHFWIYDIDLEQATEQKADKNNLNSPASLLSGSISSLENRFDVSYLKKPDSAKWFKLVPKNDDDMFQWIELAFVDGKLSAMRLNDKLGALSKFSFSNVEINPPLKNSLFVFKAPKGVEILKN